MAQFSWPFVRRANCQLGACCKHPIVAAAYRHEVFAYIYMLTFCWEYLGALFYFMHIPTKLTYFVIIKKLWEYFQHELSPHKTFFCAEYFYEFMNSQCGVKCKHCVPQNAIIGGLGDIVAPKTCIYIYTCICKYVGSRWSKAHACKVDTKSSLLMLMFTHDVAIII